MIALPTFPFGGLSMMAGSYGKAHTQLSDRLWAATLDGRRMGSAWNRDPWLLARSKGSRLRVDRVDRNELYRIHERLWGCPYPQHMILSGFITYERTVSGLETAHICIDGTYSNQEQAAILAHELAHYLYRGWDEAAIEAWAQAFVSK